MSTRIYNSLTHIYFPVSFVHFPYQIFCKFLRKGKWNWAPPSDDAPSQLFPCNPNLFYLFLKKIFFIFLRKQNEIGALLIRQCHHLKHLLNFFLAIPKRFPTFFIKYSSCFSERGSVLAKWNWGPSCQEAPDALSRLFPCNTFSNLYMTFYLLTWVGVNLHIAPIILLLIIAVQQYFPQSKELSNCHLCPCQNLSITGICFLRHF